MFYHEIWPLPVLLGWLQTLHRLLFMLDTEDQHHRLRDERSFGYKNSHTISLLPIHHKSIPSFSSRPLAVSPAMQYPPAWPLSYPLSNHLLHIIHPQPLRRSLWLVLDNRIKVIASPSSLSSEEIFRLIGIEQENSSEFVFAHLWLWCFGAWIGKSAQKWKRNCFITKINRIVLWPTERERESSCRSVSSHCRRHDYSYRSSGRGSQQSDSLGVGSGTVWFGGFSSKTCKESAYETCLRINLGENWNYFL